MNNSNHPTHCTCDACFALYRDRVDELHSDGRDAGPALAVRPSYTALRERQSALAAISGPARTMAVVNEYCAVTHVLAERDNELREESAARVYAEINSRFYSAVTQSMAELPAPRGWDKISAGAEGAAIGGAK